MQLRTKVKEEKNILLNEKQKEKTLKEGLKTNNGITLIALVITIIVLLILAGVSIAMLTGENGILNKATTAQEKTKEKSAEERVKLEVAGSLGENGNINVKELNDNLRNVKGLTYEGETIENNPIDSLPATVVVDGNNVIIREDGSVVLSEWTQTGYEITNGEITVKIGDYVLNYDEGIENTQIEAEESGYTEQQILTTEDLGWRILGIGENGGLELISDNPTTTAPVTLLGETGYLNGVEVLNRTCNELYGKGKNAESARSLKAEDINKLANYNPESKYGYGDLYKYRFSTESGYMQYSISTDSGKTWRDWSNITGKDYQTFRMPGSTERISAENPKESEEIEDTSYFYKISSKITDTNIANMITNGASTSHMVWLASRSIGCIEQYASFNLGRLFNDGMYVIAMYDSHEMWPKSLYSYFVRPIVSLQSNVHFEGNSEDGWTIIEDIF